MSSDEEPDDENPPLPWPKHDRAANVREALFVSDAELYRRLGVGPRTSRIAILALERAGQFPKKDPLFGNKRYWPAVVKRLDGRYIHVISPINPMAVRQRDPLDGPETSPLPKRKLTPRRLPGIQYDMDGNERWPQGSGKVKIRAPDGITWIEDAKPTDPASWHEVPKPRRPR